MRAVILTIYYMPSGLTTIIHNTIPPSFQGSWGKMKKWFKQRPSKLKKGYSKDLVKQTVAELFFHKPWRRKGLCQIEIIINVVFSFFRFIWIPMLWVYGHYTYFYPYSVVIDCRRQILTSKVDPRAVRVKSLLWMKWAFKHQDVWSQNNPLSPHDALKHHFTSLKTDLIFLQQRVLERKIL